MVMIAASRQSGVILIQRQVEHNAFKKVFWHTAVKNDSDRLTVLTTLHTTLYLLQRTGIQFIIQLHFRILRKLKGISLKMIKIHTHKYHGKAITDHVIHKHDIMAVALIRQSQKTPEFFYRHSDQSIFFLFFFMIVSPLDQPDSKINRIISLISQLIYLRKPHRIGKACQLISEIPANKLLLRFIQLCFIDNTKILSFKLFCQ